MPTRFLKKLRFAWKYYWFEEGCESWELRWKGICVGEVHRHRFGGLCVAYLQLPLGAEAGRGEEYHEHVIARRSTPGPARQALKRAARAVIGQLSELPKKRVPQVVPTVIRDWRVPEHLGYEERTDTLEGPLARTTTDVDADWFVVRDAFSVQEGPFDVYLYHREGTRARIPSGPHLFSSTEDVKREADRLAAWVLEFKDSCHL